jgi:hypothetical protein
MNETNSPRSTFRSMLLRACTGPSRVSIRNDRSAMPMT